MPEPDAFPATIAARAPFTMSLPRRNDPCPCGSGRKYKRCCLARDQADAQGLLRRAELVAAASGPWSVEAVPLPIIIDQPGSERPVSVLVVAGGMVLHQDLLGRLGGSPSDVAAALARAIRDAAEAVGRWPETVHVRHQVVLDALSPLLEERGVGVRLRRNLLELEDAALSLMDHMGSPAFWPPPGVAEAWLGWDLPERLVAELFEAAADFWEDAPWHVVENLQAPRCVLPSGRAWTAVVMGNGGEEFGLAIYSEASDAFEVPGLDEPRLGDPGLGFAGPSGRMVSLLFEDVSTAPRRARKELAHHGWRVAAPDAYPDLMTVNTPGGGISEEDARDLVVLLRAVPRFVVRHSADLLRELATGEPADLAWADDGAGSDEGAGGDPTDGPDAPTGVAFRYRGEALKHGVPVDFDDPLPPEVEADLERIFEERAEAFNATPLDELGGLAPAQVHDLLSAEWTVGAPDAAGPYAAATDASPEDPEGSDAAASPVRLRHDLTDTDLEGVPAHEGVRALLELAAEQKELGRTKAGNLKVVAVRAWMDRVTDRVPTWTDLEERIGDRFHEDDVPQLHWLRVLAEIAGWITPKGARFRLTREGRKMLEPGREGERYARLFETCFRRFNLAYQTSADWFEGQQQVAFTLYRLGAVAVDWVSPRTMLDRRVVLPGAEERLDDEAAEWEREGSTFFDRAAWTFETHILWPLERFGILESRRVDGARTHTYRVTSRYSRLVEFDV